jgi:hypothetical protein
MINYSCFYSSISRSPGWRPTFKYYSPWISLFGAIMCVVCMFLTDVNFALAAIVLAFLLCVYVSSSEPDTDWGPATDAVFFKSSVKSVMKLRRMNVHHAKTFRPNYLVLIHGASVSEEDRSMVRFVYTLRKGGGLAILGHVREGQGFVDSNKLQESSGHYYCALPDDVRLMKTSFMQRLGLGVNKDKGYVNYTQVTAQSFKEGGRMLISCSGLGSLRPNTVVMRYPRGWASSSSSSTDDKKKNKSAFDCEDWFALVQGAMKMRMHVAVMDNICITDNDLREVDQEKLSKTKYNTVDVYWIMDNGGVTLLIPYLMRKSIFWKLRTKRVRLIGLTAKLNEVGHKLQELKDLVAKYRFDWDVTVEILSDIDGSMEPDKKTVAAYEALPGVQKISKQKQPFWAKRWLRISEIVRDASSKASVVYITMPFPRSWMKPRDWLGWCEMLTAHGRPTVLIRGSGRDVMTNRSE